MAIYFLRHGESMANLKGVFAGQRDDSPLTKLGFEQARQAAESLKGIKIDKIITSKLKRTRQTTDTVAESIGFDVDKVETDDRIIEYDMGAITGTPLRKVTSLELTSAEGAEDATIFRERVLSFLREYKNNPENILVSSHAGVGRIIEAAKQEIDPREFYNIPRYPNGHVVKLDLSWLK